MKAHSQTPFEMTPRPLSGDPASDSGPPVSALRRSGVALLLGSLALGCAVANDGPGSVHAAEAGKDSFDPAEFRPEAGRLAADVAWLAANEREGRRAGTAGERAAGDWIAARLESLGLVPAGEDGWFQEFPVPLTPRDGGSSQVIVSGDIALAGADKLVPLFCSEAGAASGATVFCGYGILDSERGWDDFPVVEGDAIAVIVRGTPSFDAPSKTGADPADEPSWGAAGSIQLKVRNARQKGYSGVLLVSHPSAEDKSLLPFDSARSGRAGIPAVMLAERGGSLALPGLNATIAAYDEAAQPASERPLAVGGQVSMRADVERGQGTARNVLARLPGTSAQRTVVVGAHYDHLGRGGPGSLSQGVSLYADDDATIHNGADDNASGTAVVLELARVLAAGARPEADVIFALWSGEELGLLGSEYWAENPTIPWEHVRANLNLDMVGRAGDGVVQVLGAGTSSAFKQWMDEAGSRAELRLEVHAGDSGLGGSDHMTFLKREVPALFLFTGVHDDYHKPTDDFERFEAEGARRVTELADVFLGRMLAARELPFVAGERSTEPARRERGWSTWFGSIPAYAYSGPGVRFDGTQPGSPADRAGFLPGDILTDVGTVEINDIHDFVYSLQVYKPGDVVLVRFLRDGAEQEARMTMGTREVE